MAAVRERIYNPEQKDYATFLATSDETQGEFTLVEVELAPEGGNPLHTHTDFTEEFEVIEGELRIQLGDEHRVLKPGEKALVPRNVKHRFYNTSDQMTVFRVELRPGHAGFEKTLRIGYRMAGIKIGFVKNLLALGLLMDMSGTQLTGVIALLHPVFSLFANIARRQGLDKELEAQFGHKA